MQTAAESNVATSLAADRSTPRQAHAEPQTGEGDRHRERSARSRARLRLDPTTGEVRAMVGGRDFKASRFNRATQALRQPGSAFKPFVYAAALEAGYSPSSLVTGLDEPIKTLQGAWMPEDEHSTACGDDGASCAAHVEQSSGRADARGGRHRQDGGPGAQDGHGQRAERAVARARVGRSHVDGDGVRLCDVCRWRAIASGDVHSPGRRCAGEGAVRGEAVGRAGR